MSGLSRTPGKRVQGNTLTRVRIPPSPPNNRHPPSGDFPEGGFSFGQTEKRPVAPRICRHPWRRGVAGRGRGDIVRAAMSKETIHALSV